MGHCWRQCTFVSMSQTAYTCSSAVSQLFIRLSWGHQRILKLHSAYFIAEGIKAHAVFPLGFHKNALLSQWFVKFTWAKIADFEVVLHKLWCLLSPCLHTGKKKVLYWVTKLCADTKRKHTHAHTRKKGLRKKEINLLWPQFPICKMRKPD